MSIHVCQMTSVHRLDDTRIFRKQCVSLAKNQFKVTLIGTDESPGVETIDGVKVVKLRKAPLGRIGRVFLTVPRVFLRAISSNADIYHIHDPELLLIAPLLKLAGRRVVYDAHEDLVDQLYSKPWIPWYLRPFYLAVAKALVTTAKLSADGIVTATPSIESRFKSTNVACVQNFPLLETTVAVVTYDNYRSRLPAIAYIGVLSRERGALELLEAAKKWKQQGIALHMAGGFSDPQLQEAFCSELGDSFIFHGWLSQDQANEILGECRLGVVLFHPLPNHTHAQPNKLFEYMSASIPVVVSDFPLWRSVIEFHQCGLVVDPLSVDDIAEKTLWLVHNEVEAFEMGANGREAIVENYSWDVEFEKLSFIYETILQE